MSASVAYRASRGGPSSSPLRAPLPPGVSIGLIGTIQGCLDRSSPVVAAARCFRKEAAGETLLSGSRVAPACSSIQGGLFLEYE